MRRDDIDRLSTVGDDAVKTGALLYMLAQRVDGVKCLNQCFKGINAIFGVGGGVGFTAEKLNLQ